MKTIVNNLKAINEYIKGGDSEALKNELSYYDQRLNELKINFREVIITEDGEVIEQITILLANLNIPKAQWPNYIKKKNIYQLLEQLNQRGFIQIAYIQQLIDEKLQISRVKLFAAGTGVATVLLSSLFIPELIMVRLALQSFILSIFSLPVLGLIGKVFSTAYFLYDNYADQKKTLIKRLEDNGFVLAGFVVNLTAYILWIIAASPMTPLVASLFVLASLLNVAKEIISLSHFAIKYKYYREPIPTEANVDLYRSYVRNEYSYLKQRNAVFINLMAAILLVGIMASWSFVPSGIIVTICAFTALAIVALVRKYSLNKNEKVIGKQLQAQLAHLNEVENDLKQNVDFKEVAESNAIELVDRKSISSPAPVPVKPAIEKSPYLIVKKVNFLFWRHHNIEIPLPVSTPGHAGPK
ncbi:hypothetical protein ACNVED_03500 [Legionella sp. D16C41]|uniref:hypothetical protein n=1 Tax=Legionella sp. D16C41 TaxID=3402688 RepID=UPI003AF766D6